MEKGSNEAMYVLSLVVLMVSGGHNSFQHTCTPAQMNAHLHMRVHARTHRCPELYSNLDSFFVSLFESYPPFRPVQRRYMGVWNRVTLTFWVHVCGMEVDKGLC